MDKEFAYFYPIVTVAQTTAFRDDGTSYVHGVDGIRQGHIVYQGRLMCGKTQEELKEGYGAKRHKVVRNRIDGVGLCIVCQKKYKNNAASAWRKWSKMAEKSLG